MAPPDLASPGGYAAQFASNGLGLQRSLDRAAQQVSHTVTLGQGLSFPQGANHDNGTRLRTP